VTRRAGFTLIEVVVALTVTGLVIALGYAASQAGLDTEARLASYREGGERALVIRSLLSDALRHQVEGLRGGEQVFMLTNRSTSDGRPADSLQLTTKGVMPPLGASVPWIVAVWWANDSLHLAGRAATAGTSALRASLPHVAAFDVRVLGRGLAATWDEVWDTGDVAPEAVSWEVRPGPGASPSVHAGRMVVRRSLERAP